VTSNDSSRSVPPEGPSASFYQIKILLLGLEPEIWRRLIVPADATLGWLHAVLQVSMGWTNSHLHQFRHNDQKISDLSSDFGRFEDDPLPLDEHKIRLNEIPEFADTLFYYEYDFGDSWEHLIILEQVAGSGQGVAQRAVCIGGERACPPEDCGGVYGYEEFLQAISDPKHPEHAEMLGWINRPFDPGYFSADACNRWLAKLRWPKVTENALRKVLMGRDGVKE
jgi:hypothetical protein